MERKEFYKHRLPHFQQPGQAYFVTWCLKDAVPKKALKRYSDKLELLKMQMANLGAAVSEPQKINAIRKSRHPGETSEIRKLQQDYYLLRKKYIKAYDNLLDAEKNPQVNLANALNAKVISDTLLFWEGNKLENYAFCIMPNHVHWVFRVFEKDNAGEPVYLQDILYSVKRFTANRINQLEKRKGSLWQKESFDTTIRDEKHLYYAIEYTRNNPVSAGLVKDWKDWEGSWFSE